MYERDSTYEAVLFVKAIKTKSVFLHKRKVGRAKKSLNQEHKESKLPICKSQLSIDEKEQKSNSLCQGYISKQKM